MTNDKEMENMIQTNTLRVCIKNGWTLRQMEDLHFGSRTKLWKMIKESKHLAEEWWWWRERWKWEAEFLYRIGFTHQDIKEMMNNPKVVSHLYTRGYKNIYNNSTTCPGYCKCCEKFSKWRRTSKCYKCYTKKGE